jgi:predicted amidohydrolase
MTRLLKVAAAQVGAVHRSTPRKEVLDRLISLLEQASKEQVQLVVFREPSREPADVEAETTFTTFFPRYYIPDETELAEYFEREHPSGITSSVNVEPFFSTAKRLGIDVQIGYGEDTGTERFNTSVYVGRTGEVLGKYRKVGSVCSDRH